jgi:3',5'-cyclic AMP phosphodiesterase CpdA
VPARILHVSDLHFGTREDTSVERALTALVAEVEPELVVASGDLTDRGRRDQHERVARFLRSLGTPVLAIPGNHDIPYTFPARFTSPWAEFERQWETVEPVYSSPSVVAVGLNSVRPWRHQSGGLGDAQLERATERLRTAGDGSFRIVVLHHQMVGAPWRSRKKPVARRNRVLGQLVESGAELILGGHIHQASVSERHEFEVLPDDARGVVVSIAPGLGQPRPSRLGEARGLHVYTVGERHFEVETYIWRLEGWGLTAVRRFARGTEPLEVSAAAPAPPAPEPG